MNARSSQAGHVGFYGTLALQVLVLCLAAQKLAVADVLVLANRTDSQVAVTLGSGPFDWLTAPLRPGEVRAFYVPAAPVRVTLHGEAAESSESAYVCDPNRAAFIYVDEAGRLAIAIIGLAGAEDQLGLLEDTIRPHLSINRASARQPSFIVRTKLAVDEEQPLKQEVWQERLAKRLRDAAARLGRQLGVSFRCVGFATWDSDDNVMDFDAATNEFADEVPPEPAELVIGFTSQFGNVVEGESDLGNARGPLGRHILLREGTGQLLYVDRVELLVHELGHFLGAAHSPELDSAMRPRLGDHRAVRKDVLIQLDPLNCLAAAIVVDAASEMGRMPQSLMQLDPYRRYLLQRVYRTLEEALPEDPVAARYLSLVRPVELLPPGDLTTAIRRVVQAVVAEATRLRLDPAAGGPTGDSLTEHLVRTAARASADLPESVRSRAFLLGLAIALDRYDFFPQNAWLAPLYKAAESPAEREQRLQVLDHPTVYRREDLLAHFTVSAALTALVGRTLALQAGILKEEQDSRGGSGFSFADLAADLAGIEFGVRSLRDDAFIEEVAEKFEVARYVPDPNGLPEGLSEQAFVTRYGGRNDPRFLAALQALEELVRSLPGYASADDASGHPDSSNR